jgi:glycosyltransferase involved in cell wall biosynthesis
MDQRYELQFAKPQLSATEEWVARFRHPHPRRSTVLARAGFSEDTFLRRSRHAEQALAEAAGSFDLIFMLQTLFAPGLSRRPYVIYTDTTFARVHEEWPRWVPVSHSAAQKFMELERDVSSQAHTVFTMSDHARRSFIDDYGCDADRVVNVGTAMALPPANLENKTWAEPIALFVGQDFRRKGGPDLLRAWPQVRSAVPSARLVIVGPRIRRMALPEGVQWLGLVTDRQRLADLYRQAAVFVLPAHFDPMPWVLGEAMAHGLPCVVTPSCGIPELVEDGVTGRMVAPGDPALLAQVLSELLNDHRTLELMGRAGHAKVTQTARWEDVADRMAPHIEKAATCS